MKHSRQNLRRHQPRFALVIVLLLASCATTVEQRAERGNTEARVEVAKERLAYQGTAPEEKKEAIQWIQAGAEKGNPDAEFLLGTLYYRGESVPQDYIKAAEWIEKSAEQGNVEAQSFLGGLYRAGAGVRPNIDESLRWYQKAADGGDPMAQYFIGAAHDFGARTTLDPAKAAEWYRKAANAGVHQAQYNLALLYLSGRGVKRNEVEAFVWLTMAETGGSPHAGKALEELNPMLNKEEVVRGYALLAERMNAQGVTVDAAKFSDQKPESETPPADASP